MTEIRRAEIAVSVDALVSQWARQEDAPAGAALIASTEIAGRMRGGVEWRRDQAVAVGVLARPTALAPFEVELGWLVASLGAASGLERVTGIRHWCVWPDRVVSSSTSVGADELVEVVVSSVGQLGPARIEHIVLIARVAGLGDAADEAGLALVDELRATAPLLDRPEALLERYRERCSTLGRRVSISLLPRGTTRGTARDIDRTGALLLESPTGLVEPVAVAALDRLEIVDA